MGLQAIASKIQSLLEEVDGVHEVTDHPGNAPTWAVDARPERTYFEIDITGRREAPETIGAHNSQTTMVTIDGYTPWSFSRPNSTEIMRDLADAICDKIRPDHSLEGVILFHREPQLTLDRVMFPGENTPDVLTSHLRITLECRERKEYSERRSRRR